MSRRLSRGAGRIRQPFMGLRSGSFCGCHALFPRDNAFSLRPVRRLCSSRGCGDLATIDGYGFDHGG